MSYVARSCLERMYRESHVLQYLLAQGYQALERGEEYDEKVLDDSLDYLKELTDGVRRWKDISKQRAQR